MSTLPQRAHHQPVTVLGEAQSVAWLVASVVAQRPRALSRSPPGRRAAPARRSANARTTGQPLGADPRGPRGEEQLVVVRGTDQHQFVLGAVAVTAFLAAHRPAGDAGRTRHAVGKLHQPSGTRNQRIGSRGWCGGSGTTASPDGVTANAGSFVGICARGRSPGGREGAVVGRLRGPDDPSALRPVGPGHDATPGRERVRRAVEPSRRVSRRGAPSTPVLERTRARPGDARCRARRGPSARLQDGHGRRVASLRLSSTGFPKLPPGVPKTAWTENRTCSRRARRFSIHATTASPRSLAATTTEPGLRRGPASSCTRPERPRAPAWRPRPARC